ncbi:hypothetical protein [Streptomyces erythrochromogenes]|uniref:hypothetical protein n=1 Tax=Streptomyces erythrochromogenes TaxID=285574 RepID=UPI0037FDFEEE
MSTVTEAHYEMVASTDAGRTWSAPTTVARDTSVPEVHPNDPAKALRAGSTLPSAYQLATLPHGDPERQSERRISRASTGCRRRSPAAASSATTRAWRRTAREYGRS